MTGSATSKPSAPARERFSPELAALGLAFRGVFRSLNRMRGRDTHLGGGEISHAQFELLIELSEQGELSVGELALAARLSPASVTQMLDGLADSGHVERTRSDSDRRVVLARLTSLGQARVEAKRAAWQGRWEAALGDISPRELKAAAKVLERLGAMFEGESAAACEAPLDSAPEAAGNGRNTA